jgi:hypothetical protein
MADFYYDLLVVSCRGQHDTSAVGSNDFKTRSVPNRSSWNFTYFADDVDNEAAGKAAFLAAMEAAIPSAPKHISKILSSGTGSLKTALTASATVANDGTASSGKYNERVGKDVFRYEIGVAAASAAAALSARTAHNLV